MKDATKKLIFILTLILIIAHPCMGFSIAQSGEKLMKEISRGEKFTSSIAVQLSEGEEASIITIEVFGYGYNEQNAISIVPPQEDNNPYSARPFITPEKFTFNLKPEEAKQATFTFNIPSNIKDGKYFALIRILRVPEAAGQVTIGTAILKEVVLTVKNSKLVSEGEITNVTVEAESNEPIQVYTTVKNTGNTPFRLSNAVEIFDSNHNLLNTEIVNRTGVPLIPGMSWTLDTQYSPETALPLGYYSYNSKISLPEGTLLDENEGTFEIQEAYVPPPAATSIMLSPSGGNLVTSDGRIRVAFPAGAVSSSATVSFKSITSAEIPAVPRGVIPGSTAFRLDGIAGLLAKDATVTVQYTEDDLAVAGEDPSILYLARWNEGSAVWQFYKTERDTNAKTLTATTNQLSTWAVMAVTDEGLLATETPLSGTLCILAIITGMFVIGRRSK